MENKQNINEQPEITNLNLQIPFDTTRNNLIDANDQVSDEKLNKINIHFDIRVVNHKNKIKICQKSGQKLMSLIKIDNLTKYIQINIIYDSEIINKILHKTAENFNNKLEYSPLNKVLSRLLNYIKIYLLTFSNLDTYYISKYSIIKIYSLIGKHWFNICDNIKFNIVEYEYGCNYSQELIRERTRIFNRLLTAVIKKDNRMIKNNSKRIFNFDISPSINCQKSYHVLILQQMRLIEMLAGIKVKKNEPKKSFYFKTIKRYCRLIKVIHNNSNENENESDDEIITLNPKSKSTNLLPTSSKLSVYLERISHTKPKIFFELVEDKKKQEVSYLKQEMTIDKKKDNDIERAIKNKSQICLNESLQIINNHSLLNKVMQSESKIISKESNFKLNSAQEYIDKNKISSDQTGIYYVFNKSNKINFGEAIYVSGSCKELGNWEINKATRLDCYDSNKWIKRILINQESFPFEFKFFKSKYGSIHHQINWIGEDNIKVDKYNYIPLKHGFNSDSVSVMSFNLRYENNLDKSNIWENRKNLVVKTIHNYCPDILAIQEGRQNQVSFLCTNLKAINSYIGLSRTNYANDEQCGIFINDQKFILQNWGQFWLSETPHKVGSISYKNIFPRIVTWTKLFLISEFIEKNIHKVFYIFNTHLDEYSAFSRVPCVKVLLAEIEKIVNGDNHLLQKIIILVGSFISDDSDLPIQLIKSAGFKSSSDEVNNFKNTFHNFTGEGTKKMDHIFYKAPNLNLNLRSNYNLIDERLQENGDTIYLSDHFPIISFISF